ncbi:MAG TPA: phosphotransacetylase, partial [Methanoculleus sp.]|nr:phosphotransacetylase [Methanoculleus sp.]
MIIGIGAGAGLETILSSLAAWQGSARICVYTSPELGSSFEGQMTRVSSDPAAQMIGDLCSGAIDAAVRGNLPANHTLSLLRKMTGVSSLERVALLETASGKRFLLAPVGVDEGWTVKEKISLVERARPMAEAFGLNNRVGIMSGGRLGDIGRHPRVDRTIEDALEVAAATGGDHVEILIEKAAGEYGVIIAPDGISGNLIFRTLALLGEGKAHGAPVGNIGRIFVDTSRASSDYSNALF